MQIEDRIIPQLLTGALISSHSLNLPRTRQLPADTIIFLAVQKCINVDVPSHARRQCPMRRRCITTSGTGIELHKLRSNRRKQTLDLANNGGSSIRGMSTGVREHGSFRRVQQEQRQTIKSPPKKKRRKKGMENGTNKKKNNNNSSTGKLIVFNSYFDWGCLGYSVYRRVQELGRCVAGVRVLKG